MPHLWRFIVMASLCLPTGVWGISSDRLNANTDAPSILDCIKGRALRHEDAFSAALPHLNRCMSLALPKSVRAPVLRDRAFVLSALGMPNQAAQDQLIFIQLSTVDSVWPYVMLGYYYRVAKQYVLALDALQKAKAYDEDGPGTGPGMAVYYHTGKILYDTGRFHEAIDAFSEGISKQVDYGLIYYFRAKAYEALNMGDQARGDYKKSKQLISPDDYNDELIQAFKKYGLMR